MIKNLISIPNQFIKTTTNSTFNSTKRFSITSSSFQSKSKTSPLIPLILRSMSNSTNHSTNPDKRSVLPLPKDSSENQDIYGEFPKPELERAKEVKEKMEEVEKRIGDAFKGSVREKRGDKQPRLVAISKLHPPSSILASHLHTGQRHFGENYVQELVEKSKVLPSDFENGIRWHFVGGLQSNKGKLLASIPNLYLLETLDSIKASNVLEKALKDPSIKEKRSEPLYVYLQVNTSGEDVKSGLPPILKNSKSESNNNASSDDPNPLYDLTKHVILNCPNLRFKGLMTIGSASNSEQSSKIKDKNEADNDDDDIKEILKLNPDFDKLIQTRNELIKLLRSDSDENLKKVEILESYKELLSSSSSSKEDGENKVETETDTGGLELSMGMSSDLELAVKIGSDNVRVGTDCFGKRLGSRDEAMKAMESELKSKD